MTSPQFSGDTEPVLPPRAVASGHGVAGKALWVGLAAALVAAAGAAILWQGARHGAAPWVALTAAALLAVAYAAYLAGHWAGRAALRAEVHGVRQQLAVLSQLQDAWLWRSDAQHLLLQWQAPASATPALAAAIPAPATPLPAWAFLLPGDAAAGQALATRMQARAALNGLTVQPAPKAAAWQCHGLPCLDAQGLFCGYVGLARPTAPVAAAPAAADALAQRADDEQAAFNYTVSHDLRAPVRVVEGFTRILKEDYGRLLDRIGNDHLDRVLSAAARMNSMIDAMLALARLSTQPLVRQPVNLSQMAEYVIDDLRRAQPDRQVRVQIAPGLVAHGDPTLLRQVMENLLGNAWKYTGKRSQATISLGSELRDGRTLYWVQDDGAGFDMRYADRLFGAFQRLHSANEFAGTGVGLASTRRILRRHGGDIWAQAEPDHGARFEFTLTA